MAQLYTKVKLYLEANGKTKDEFETPLSSGTVLLRNKGSSPSDAFIDKWEVSGLVQPTQEQLDALDAQANTLESNQKVDETRRTAYGSWNDQLNEIYHDIDSWKARIKSIKDSNPKS
jgi:vacuolar-type H+-ATPase subunit I/STV1